MFLDGFVCLVSSLQAFWWTALASTRTSSTPAVCVCPQLVSFSWPLSTGWTDKIRRRRPNCRPLLIHRSLLSSWPLTASIAIYIHKQGKHQTRFMSAMCDKPTHTLYTVHCTVSTPQWCMIQVQSRYITFYIYI